MVHLGTFVNRTANGKGQHSCRDGQRGKGNDGRPRGKGNAEQPGGKNGKQGKNIQTNGKGKEGKDAQHGKDARNGKGQTNERQLGRERFRQRVPKGKGKFGKGKIPEPHPRQGEVDVLLQCLNRTKSVLRFVYDIQHRRIRRELINMLQAIVWHLQAEVNEMEDIIRAGPEDEGEYESSSRSRSRGRH